MNAADSDTLSETQKPEPSLDQSDFDQLLRATDHVAIYDKYRLRRWLNKIRRSPSPEQLSKWQSALATAVELKNWRSQQSWQPVLQDDLPITQHQQKIADAIRDHQTIIVCGETGSGKSTQLPLIALGCGLAVDGIIGHTQPRRIAAQSIAARIASQLKTPLGQTVGYKIRFGDKTNRETLIKLMTDGMLLSETQTDRFLNQYSVLIVDEAHERSLNIDFLLGNLKRILEKRPELKLIITSATIDTERFAEHFQQPSGEPAPVFNIEGRTYPVDIQYNPPPSESEFESAEWLVEQTAETLQTQRGDILVFLPTEQDIRTAHKKLRGAVNKTSLADRVEILPLYARLSSEQQNSIFNPGKKRRVVLATNVAESSITVPRISCVIDTGTARISRYSPRNKVQRLPIEAISQASANQRAGRCGRIGPGVCIRLFSKDDFEGRADYTTPEIRRTNLASVILQAEYLRLGHVESFPFIDPPRPEAIRDGYKTLYEIGAIDHQNRLTDIGRKLAKLPVDPRIGRMIIAAADENCVADVLIIASALELQDPRLRPAEKQKAADEKHEQFRDDRSDFVALLNIWDFYHKLKSELSRSKLQLACKQNFLSFNLLRQWQQLHHQLKTIAKDNGIKSTHRTENHDAIHRSLLTGLLSGIAMLSDKFEYTGAGGIKFRLWPGSAVFSKKPKWIVAAEIVETSQRFGRTIAQINPNWIEPLASHLTKSTFSQPHWSSKAQTVMAHERVSLFGLPIVAARRKPYGKIDPQTSRSIFIEQGLVENQIREKFKFLEHNLQLLDDIRLLAAKTRRRDFVVDSFQLLDFYNTHLPENAFDVASLRNMIRRDSSIDEQLKMSIQDVVDDEAVAAQSDENSVEQQQTLFPDQIQVNALTASVQYKFEPGDEADGATIELPKLALSQLDDTQTPWLIPGLIEPHIIALIRSLPKSIRRNFVPAPDTARKVAADIQGKSGSFLQCVAESLSKFGQTPLEISMFRLEKIEQYLKPNIRVLDDSSEIIAQDRSIARLRANLEIARDSTVTDSVDHSWNATQLKTWDWPEIPQQLMIRRGSSVVPVFPALQDHADSVSQILMDSKDAARRTTDRGIARLFQIANRKNIKSQVNWLPDLERLAMLGSTLFDLSELKQALGDLMSRIAFVESNPACTTRTEFENRQATAAEKISIATAQIAKWLPRFLESFHQTRLKLDELPKQFAETRSHIQAQIATLTEPGFLQSTAWRWLQHFPRYFQAIISRIEKRSSTSSEKEFDAIGKIDEHWHRFEITQQDHLAQGIVDSELELYRWMIEEYRVSLFAQQLGTSMTVSPQRLDKQWRKVRVVSI